MAKSRGWRILGLLAGAVLTVWILAAFGLGILLPFLMGYLVARLAEPLVCRMARGSRLPEWACSGLCVTMVLLSLLLAALVLGQVLLTEALDLAQRIPVLLAAAETPWKELKLWLMDLALRAPDGLGRLLRSGLEQIFDNGSMLLEKGSEWLLSAATGLITGLPDLMLFVVTAVLAGYMISARLPQLRRLAERWVPQNWKTQITEGRKRLKAALGGWCKAQCKLMGITFLILTAGFVLLGVSAPVLTAGLLALVDALPVFGVGMALIPWAVFSFVQQNTYRGVGLLILYGVAALTRTGLEPRLIGKQIGLNPLLTLLAMYAGYKLCGLAGMILFPVAAILVRQFLELWEQSGK